MAKPVHTDVYHKPTSPRVPLDSITLTGNQTGWGLSTYAIPGKHPTILRTNTGGTVWTDVSPNMTRVVHGFIDNSLEVVAAFPDSSHAVLAVGVTRGTSGAGLYAKDICVFSTTDGGKHWSSCRIRDNLPPNTYGQVPMQLNFINSSTGWMTTKVQDPGGEMYLRGALYQTTDGGKTWHLVNVSFGDHPGMTAADGMPEDGWVSFTSKTVGFTLGQGPTQTDLLSHTDVSLYRTEDGGKSWTKVSMRFPALPNPKLGRYKVIPPERVGETLYLPVLVEHDANPVLVSIKRQWTAFCRRGTLGLEPCGPNPAIWVLDHNQGLVLA
jgi:photosystem II stability/assembly factor-like uncharacterized protein